MNVVSPLKKSQEISPAVFAQFLALLAPEPEQAGEVYEELRQMLTKFFECRSVAFADDLTDEVFNRVMRRVSEGEVLTNIPGYCFSVARFIILEQARAPENKRVDFEALPPLAAPDNRNNETDDLRLACLRSCLSALTEENHALIVEYYQDIKRTKIDVRQQMTLRLGVSRNALTNRMLRLRTKLEKCMTRCVKK